MAGIAKPATLHTLRDGFATHLLKPTLTGVLSARDERPLRLPPLHSDSSRTGGYFVPMPM